MKKKNLLLSFIVFFLFFIINIVILSDYGISWDSPIHFIRGQAYIEKLIPQVQPRSIYQNNKLSNQPANFTYFQNNDSGHPPLNAELASLSNFFFYQKLNFLGDTEGYNFTIVAISSFLVGLIFLFVISEYGLFAGIIATLSLSTYPLFFGELHFNIKDPIETTFYSATIIFAYWGITKNSWKYILASSIFAGLALGTKFNILFSLISILPWIILYSWKQIKNRKWPFSLSLTRSFLFYLIIPFSILYLTWPFLWKNPVGNFLKTIRFYQDLGFNSIYQSAQYNTVGSFNTYAIQWIFYTTPLVILFFTIIGLIYLYNHGLKESKRTSLLILFWLIIPILRVSIPNAGIYGGTRQIMEYIPAISILSGIGAYYLINLIRKLSSNKKIAILANICLIAFFVPIIYKLISIHPNENVFFNSLSGGLKGAKEKNIPYWGNSFGNTYKQAANWLNLNAEKNAKVYLAVGYASGMPSIWLRKDLSLSDKYRQDYLSQRGEYIVEITSNMPLWGNYCNWTYVQQFLNPIYEIKVDNISILSIWKNDREHTKPIFYTIERNIILNNCTPRKD